MFIKSIVIFVLFMVGYGGAKVILDIDPGPGDSHSLLMLLSRQTSVLAVTVSQGNSFLSNVTHNTLRTLRLCGRLDIPVFLGNEYTLDGHVKNTSIYFGLNGFGNVPDDTYNYSKYLRQPENAWQALVRLVHTFPNEITLISLGSQTNIARAMLEHEDFGKLLKKNIIMGIGNESPKGEFNFLVDACAADHVLQHLTTEIVIIPWELCLNFSVSWEWYDAWVGSGTPKSNFIKHIGQFGKDRAIRDQEPAYILSDELAAAVFLEPSIILESEQIVARVETLNQENYAEMVVDWDSEKENKNLQLVTSVDLKKVEKILEDSVKEEQTCVQNGFDNIKNAQC